MYIGGERHGDFVAHPNRYLSSSHIAGFGLGMRDNIPLVDGLPQPGHRAERLGGCAARLRTGASGRLGGRAAAVERGAGRKKLETSRSVEVPERAVRTEDSISII